MCSKPRILILVLPLLLTLPVLATTYVMMTDEDLFDQATLVASVRIVSRGPGPATGPIMTDYQVEVEEIIKGEIVGDDVVVRVLGGTRNEVEFVAFGVPRFRRGERVVLFLEPRPDGTYGILHLILGSFHERVVNQKRLLVRNLSEAGALSGAGEDRRRYHLPRNSDRFISWLRDRAAQRIRAVDYLEKASSVDGFRFFTMLGTQTRHNPFTTTGVWRLHDVGQSNLTGTPKGRIEAEAAMAIWNSDATSSISFSVDTTTPTIMSTDTGFDSSCTLPNSIVWLDPNSVVSGTYSCTTGGVLANGGYCAFTSPDHVFHGQFFRTAIGVNVRTNDGTTCETAKNMEETLAHEFGHALGFGHSCGDTNSGPCVGGSDKDNALMRSFIHGGSVGAFLDTEDRLAADYSYGLGSGPTATPAFPTPPSTPTPTVTPTETPVPPTATPTETPVPPTATPTETPVPPTVTPTETPVPPTVTPTETPVPPTATPTETPVPPTATPTETPVPPTATPTETPVPPTATPTETPVPPTATPTETPVPPTATPTETPVPPTATPTETPVPPTATPTETPVPPTATPTETPVPPTATPTETPVPPTATPTETPVPPTATPTETPVPPTATPTETPVLPTATPTETPVPPTATPTETPIPPATATATAVATSTPSATPSPTATTTATPSQTPTPSPSSTFTSTPTATPTPGSTPGPSDHFLSYLVRNSRGAPKFEKREVVLEDQFQVGRFKVDKRIGLANPADKNDEGITADQTHLTVYRVKSGRFSRRRVRVENQFGEEILDVRKPNRLMVPASKSLEMLLESPDLSAIQLDHFLCYPVKQVALGGDDDDGDDDDDDDESPGLQAFVRDQFGARLYDVLKPNRLCNPVNKNAEGIKNPKNHLLCYGVKLAEGESKLKGVKNIFVNDQFGPGKVDTVRERELCVPSSKELF